MRIIDPFVEIHPFNGARIMKNIEEYGRTCYKSESRITEDSYKSFIKKIINSGHESVIEHEKITVMFICDRGITHEIVRHRIGSYSQESTRYCNYSQDKFGQEITVIEPYYLKDSRSYELWVQACESAEKSYMEMLEIGMSPQEARAVLPTCLKTEIVATYNLREWRHFFKLRCAAGAHPQMRQVAIPLLLFLREQVPLVFDDIPYDETFDPGFFAQVLWANEIREGGRGQDG